VDEAQELHGVGGRVMARLTQREVKSAVREVERKLGKRFDAPPRVQYGPKRDATDFAHWKTVDARGGRVRPIITLADDEPKESMQGWLRHELEESLRRFHGEPLKKAHNAAVKSEKEWLARLHKKDPKKYSDKRGTPYVKALWLRRKLLGAPKVKPKTALGKPARGWRWW